MGRVNVTDDGNSRKYITVCFRTSDQFDSSHYIHKYYLSHEDKGKLFPVDISALEVMVDLDEEMRINFCDGVVPDDLPECTIFYQDIGLEKKVDSDLVRRALLAVSQYKQDRSAELTPEEIRAALNLNEWLRGYEKTLLAKQQSIEEELKNGLRGNDPFLVDYEIELKMDFYLCEDDPMYDNEDADCNDWDKHAALYAA